MRARVLLLVAVCLAGLPARAQNPTVSLRLADVAFPQAAEALSRAAGIPVRHFFDTVEAGKPPLPPELLEPASFDWTNVCFGRALRELCERYRLRPMPGLEGYVLQPAPDVRPAPRLAQARQGDLLLFVSRISLSSDRQPIGVPPVGGPAMWLELGCLLERGEAEELAGIDNLVARDDRGARLEALTPLAERAITFPDEWGALVAMEPPGPRARRLAWLQGDLMVRRIVRRGRLEAALSEREERVRLEGEGAVLTLQPRWRPLGVRGRTQRWMLHLEAEFILPGRSRDAIDPDSLSYSFIVGGGRRPGRVQESRIGVRWDTDGYHCEVAEYYGPLESRAGRFRLTWVERGPREKLCSFRLTDVPLPRGDGTPDVAEPGPLSRSHPLYAYPGGVLRVRLPSGLPAGSVWLGLSRQEGPGWGPVRWIEADVELPGSVRVPNLAPGRYRVRVRTASGTELLSGEAAIRSGRETEIPER